MAQQLSRCDDAAQAVPAGVCDVEQLVPLSAVEIEVSCSSITSLALAFLLLCLSGGGCTWHLLVLLFQLRLRSIHRVWEKMTAVFDIAAGVVGVAGFAAQIADGIRKLRDFCDRVQDAPRELQDLVGDIDIAGKLLDRLNNGVIATAQHGLDPTLLRECIDRCRRATSSITSVADELSKDMPKKSFRTSLKKVWIDDKITRAVDRLRHCKDDLYFAQTLYSNAQLRHDIALASHSIAQLRHDVARSDDQSAALIQLMQTQQQSIIGLQTAQTQLSQQLQLACDCIAQHIPYGHSPAIKQIVTDHWTVTAPVQNHFAESDIWSFDCVLSIVVIWVEHSRDRRDGFVVGGALDVFGAAESHGKVWSVDFKVWSVDFAKTTPPFVADVVRRSGRNDVAFNLRSALRSNPPTYLGSMECVLERRTPTLTCYSRTRKTSR